RPALRRLAHGPYPFTEFSSRVARGGHAQAVVLLGAPPCLSSVRVDGLPGHRSNGLFYARREFQRLEHFAHHVFLLACLEDRSGAALRLARRAPASRR